MADGVHHIRIREDLNLNREDLGLNPKKYTAAQVEEIWQEITRSVRERDRELLLCVARAHGESCKAEHSGVKSPHMIVRKHRGPDGALRWRAAHLPTPHDMTAEESDKHKATKDFIARTCDKAGLDYATEKATKTRTARPDSTVFGKGGPDQGIEAQFYNASADTVRRRSRNHAEAGLVANWITDDATFHLVDRANYIIIPRYTWKQIDDAADIAAMGGARVLVEWTCTADGSGGRPCPDGLLYGAARGVKDVGCGNVHLQWETPRLIDGDADDFGTRAAFTAGRIIVGAATGDMESLFVPSRKDRRAGAYLWVPSSDKAKWLEEEGGESAPDRDGPDLEDEVFYSQEEIGDACTYGEKTFDPAKVKSAPLKRRGLASLSRTIKVASPATDLPASAPAEPVGPGISYDAAGQPIPLCRFGCGAPASMPGPEGFPEHWTCRERQAKSGAVT